MTVQQQITHFTNLLKKLNIASTDDVTVINNRGKLSLKINRANVSRTTRKLITDIFNIQNNHVYNVAY